MEPMAQKEAFHDVWNVIYHFKVGIGICLAFSIASELSPL